VLAMPQIKDHDNVLYWQFSSVEDRRRRSVAGRLGVWSGAGRQPTRENFHFSFSIPPSNRKALPSCRNAQLLLARIWHLLRLTVHVFFLCVLHRVSCLDSLLALMYQFFLHCCHGFLHHCLGSPCAGVSASPCAGVSASSCAGVSASPCTGVLASPCKDLASCPSTGLDMIHVSSCSIASFVGFPYTGPAPRCVDRPSYRLSSRLLPAQI